MSVQHQPPHRTASELLEHCAEVSADDGIDPRDFEGRDHSSRKPRRKTWQLCSQVADRLSYVLSGETDDDVLSALLVVGVEPAPDASRLLVTVAPQAAERAVDPAAVLSHLEAASGRLRSAVAAAITRKRAPKLVFRLKA